jgi:hypothetical protein
MNPLCLDLFAGTGSATNAFRQAGWEVVRVELNPAFEAEHHADIRDWHWTGRRPTLIWASPPCTEFARESMPWCKTGKQPSMELVDATERIIRECNPQYWCIENVRGARPWFDLRFGNPLCLGPVRLWGNFPRFYCDVPGWKESLSSTQEAERAAMPPQIGQGLLWAIEHDLYREFE